MITTLDIVDVLWAAINGSALKSAISGGIYKGARPVNSSKEDIVINCLPVPNTQLQTAIANVNIHVPNVVQNLNGIQDDTQPNYARLKALATMAVGVLQDKWQAGYHYDVQQQVMIQDEQAKSHYINIRVEFYNLNF